MKISKKQGIWLSRSILVILALIPLVYWREFYNHFYVYLTGTVITDIVRNQWQLVVFFALLFLAFLLPLSYRRRARWAEYSLVAAFFVSLFVEMYGLPLTILFASKYLFTPGVELPPNVITLEFLGVGLGLDHAMVYGAFLMILGGALIALGWWSLYRQAKRPGFACFGLYSVSRHPQYAGFALLILGWLFGWPTLLTVIFSPILIYKYVQAARKEEQYMAKQFGQEYSDYRKDTPFLI